VAKFSVQYLLQISFILINLLDMFNLILIIMLYGRRFGDALKPPITHMNGAELNRAKSRKWTEVVIGHPNQLPLDRKSTKFNNS
jgi:hypothetical protein